MLASRQENVFEGAAAAVRGKARFYRQVWFWVIVAMILGGWLGAADPALGVAMAPLGTGFIKLISMLIAPLVFCTMVSGVARMSNMARIGQVMLKIVLLFEGMSLWAMIVAAVVMDLLQPGRGMNIAPASMNAALIQSYVVPVKEFGPAAFLMDIIPESFGDAFVGHHLLQVVFLSIATGFAVIGLRERAAPFVAALDSFMEVLFALVRMVMYLAPVGAFGSIAFGIGKFGLKSIVPLSKFIATFYLADIIIVFSLGFTFAAVCKFSFLKYLRYFRSEILLTVATTSSEVVMPQIIRKMDRLGCKPGVAGIIVPAGYTFNPTGIGPYMVMAVIFLAQAMNIGLSIVQQIELIAIIHLTSKSSAGVAGTAFVILIGTMNILGAVPVAGATLMLGIHRLLAQAFVPAFAFTNPLAAIGVSRWEGDLDHATLRRVLDEKAPA